MGRNSAGTEERPSASTGTGGGGETKTPKKSSQLPSRRPPEELGINSPFSARTCPSPMGGEGGRCPNGTRGPQQHPRPVCIPAGRARDTGQGGEGVRVTPSLKNPNPALEENTTDHRKRVTAASGYIFFFLVAFHILSSFTFS